MDLSKQIARVKAILGTPRTEWPVIATEPATIGDIYKDYVLILAAIPAVVFYNKLSTDADRIVANHEAFADEFATLLGRQLDDAA